MDVSTPEEAEARNQAGWDQAAKDLELLAKQACEKFFQVFGMVDPDPGLWLEFAKYLWESGARPMKPAGSCSHTDSESLANALGIAWLDTLTKDR